MIYNFFFKNILTESDQIKNNTFLELTISNINLLSVLKFKNSKNLMYISAGYNIDLNNATNFALKYISETIANPIRYVC